ncbi:Serine hydrolase FSH [Niveomyces insectorum RCEF 264]|uniref:Serine hydrolase FSH n=1 Tax=Niveomyces insectorum RCEF 264 TaxID=1081102 RepID=A0A167T648_9HYPO|nr:Serine hydrolase FSH [Niveomyces insectorum RCEF 264]
MADSQASTPGRNGAASGPAAKANDKREVKILMLHGYTQSGPLFRAKTRALEKMLQKSLAPFRLVPVLVYPTAPNRLRPQDIPGYEAKDTGNADQNDDAATVSDSWAWWRRDDASGAYRLLNEGMSSLATAIADAGGVDGVLGFSQGGAAAALLAAAMEQQPARPPPPPTASGSAYDWSWVDAVRAANGHRPLRFAVVYSGFFAPPPELQWLYTPAIATPSLHYIGGLDTVVDESRCQALVERFVDPVVLVHPGGHYVPIGKEWVMPLVAFVKKHAEEAGQDTSSKTKI